MYEVSYMAWHAMRLQFPLHEMHTRSALHVRVVMHLHEMHLQHAHKVHVHVCISCKCTVCVL